MHKKPYYKKFTPDMLEDVRKIRINEMGLKEIQGAIGVVRKDHLVHLVERADQAYVIYDQDDNPHGVFGITSIHEGVGVPWLLHSGEVSKSNPKEFWLGSVEIFKQWTQDYELMFNYICTENSVGISWLQRLGFTVQVDEELTLVDPTIKFYQFVYHKE